MHSYPTKAHTMDFTSFTRDAQQHTALLLAVCYNTVVVVAPATYDRQKKTYQVQVHKNEVEDFVETQSYYIPGTTVQDEKVRQMTARCMH